jgi:hypothetical protein
MCRGRRLPDSVNQFLPQPFTAGFRHFHMNGAKPVKKGVCSSPRFVDNLIHHNDIFGLNLIPQRTDGAAGQQGRSAQLLEGENVSLIRNGGRIKFVPLTVAIQKRHFGLVNRPYQDRAARKSKRRIYFIFFNGFHTRRQRVAKSCPTDNSYHIFIPSSFEVFRG